MPELFCVRADYGRYTKNFLQGDYIAIGWLADTDLSNISTRNDLYPLYKADYPEESILVVGQQVGQIARFLLEIKAGDYVITPGDNSEFIYYGTVESYPSYFYADASDGCPFLHRRKVKWNRTPVLRSIFSVPFQNTIRSSLTVFAISHKTNFFESIGKPELVPASLLHDEFDYYKTVLNRILLLDAREFEILVTHLLSALGFEGAEHTGKTGDGGVDAIGELDVSGLAKIKIFVQAKRYSLEQKIAASVVKALRQSIPSNGQGAFIVTCDFQAAATDIATEPGFPKIGLINGTRLVDILAKHWDDIPIEFRYKLNLKLGLVTA